MEQKTIWTIGHSTRAAEEFISILQKFNIELLVDVRLLPGSKRRPQFNKEQLEHSLKKSNIRYLHFKDLGGRRKPRRDSKNTALKEDSFRGYADYMETDAFKLSVDLLQKKARNYKTVYMCSEALWQSCHRSLVSDYLKVNSWQVIHILNENKSEEHRYKKSAHIVDGHLIYNQPDLFS